jgi:hypothetical protein
MYPESPGFAVIELSPLIKLGDCAEIANAPVPLFLKPMYQPVDNEDVIGRVNEPAPLFQANVAARLASLIVGVDVTFTIFSVVASLPDMVVKPAP